MKTMKLYLMAALALTFAACSNDDNDFAQQPLQAEGIPFTATISIDNGATMRALNESSGKIEATWKDGEEVALIYNAGGTPTKTPATVTKQTDGSAIISATLASGATDGSDVTIIYPSTAADGTTGNVISTLLAAQDGTLTGTGGTSIAEKYDVRKGTGKLSITGGKATVNNGTPGTSVSLTNQNAIFKLTLKDIDGTNDVSATSVKIYDQTNALLTTVTPATGYDKVMYVALPTTATTLKFSVTNGTTNYFNMASGLSLGANYYPSTLKLATVGNVIAANGKCYKDASAATTASTSAVAMIAYLGNDAETSTTYNHGLALALEDVSSSTITWCSQSTETCLTTQYNNTSDAKADMAGLANTNALVIHASHTHNAAKEARNYNGGTHPTGTSTWFLPSAGQWDKMVTAAGGYVNLNIKASLNNRNYWSSSECTKSQAWDLTFTNGSWGYGNKRTDWRVRACLAF
ncbi:MAG: hypothetical protein IJV13_10360 [Prevotella sp.]|nr:hypothetical protein [Prevotella sp.]